MDQATELRSSTVLRLRNEKQKHQQRKRSIMKAIGWENQAPVLKGQKMFCCLGKTNNSSINRRVKLSLLALYPSEGIMGS